MTATVDRPVRTAPGLPPNWFASVMGTGVVAIAATALPWRVPGLHLLAIVTWLLATAMLAGLGVAVARRPAAAASARHNPVLVYFYGAVPMAVLTVGTSTLVVGRDVIGLPAALAVDTVLWTAGTVGGVITAIVVPRHVRYRPDDAFAGWLMPLVPPTVSASAGALLAAHVPAGPLRDALLVGCWLLLAGSVAAAAVVIATVVRRFVRCDRLPARLRPTWWIVLGPLGQSVTAACLLAEVDDSTPLRALAVVYGVPVSVLALAWSAVCVASTVRAARDGLPFSLAWWSFTFPVGTCVTGAAGLARLTGAPVYAVAATVLFAGLVTAWAVVAARTVRERHTLVAAGPVSRAE